MNFNGNENETQIGFTATCRSKEKTRDGNTPDYLMNKI